jgi:hypothetical protein
MVIKALKPLIHHGDCPPAANISDEFLMKRPRKTPTSTVPVRYRVRIVQSATGIFSLLGFSGLP